MDNKTNINWYPGHMAKTKRLIKENISLIDIVFEVIDSRVPKSSKIPDLRNLIGNKPVIYIFTKYDLCDKEETDKFIKEYEKDGYVLKYDLTKNIDVKNLVSISKEVLKDKIDKLTEKGLKKENIRGLVVGVPNAGKSTLINKLAGKNIASAGNKPGVTKSLSWINVSKEMQLLDTPGVLWPKLDEESVAFNLAATTAIKEEILEKEKIACYIIEFLYKYYPNILNEVYNVTDIEDFDQIYTTIGKKYGFIMKGAEVDYDRVTDKIINDIKQGKIIGITFDRF